VADRRNAARPATRLRGEVTPRRRYYDDGLPTACTTLRAGYVRVLVFCNSCRHQADADLHALVPLNQLRFRCSQCGTDRTDFVVT
jgi:hypothetical protein